MFLERTSHTQGWTRRRPCVGGVLETKPSVQGHVDESQRQSGRYRTLLTSQKAKDRRGGEGKEKQDDWLGREKRVV